MEIRELLLMMTAGAVIGAFGQSLRMVVGLSKAMDESSQKGVDFKQVFDGSRLIVSLLIGAIAGGLGILTLTNFAPLPDNQLTGQMFFGVIGIGYAGTDFIEGFIAKYLPSKPDVAPSPGSAAQVAAAAAAAAVTAQPAESSASHEALMSAVKTLTAASGKLAASAAVASTTSSALSPVELSCQSRYAEGKADCNRFAKLVAADFGVTLRGDANSIAQQISSANAAMNGWTFLGDGPESGAKAAAAAEQGLLVLGARDEGAGNHGHVVVVVGGPLARGQYPRAYWGTLNYNAGEPDTWGLNKTTNYAWTQGARDNVVYASRPAN